MEIELQMMGESEVDEKTVSVRPYGERERIPGEELVVKLDGVESETGTD